ncbi:PREDICTED: N-terminal kinase-like protein, partial [Amphimedon queenslandica]|uniref:Protein kinase domain-containing protein n=1 Tax=Amphimedon queenslandica TaxID=400682 RepID=A0AAN0JZK6_AMPQE
MYSYNDTNVPLKTFQYLNKYDPPENMKQAKRKTEKWSRDMWGLGCLLWEVFNGPIHQSSNLRDTSKFPKSLSSHYLQCVNANPMARPNPSELLQSLKERGGYLSNTFISLNLKIEELQLMEADRKNHFFVELNKSLDLFPDSFAHHKVLPHLLNVFEFGGAGPTVLAPLLKIGKLLPEDEYQRKIVPCIVRSFGSNDRATRLNLLQHLDQFIDQLQPSVLNNSLFGQIVTGFTDTVPTIREHTIKASLLLAPKLNDSNLSQLLKFFAKCQLDEQAGIRTNTTICLGKIAPHLNSKTRDRVLVSAFTRSLKDPFPPARSAGIGALGSTLSYYTPVDMATRIIPSLSHMTVDKDQSVREQTFKVLRLYVDKLEEHSKKMEPSSDGEGIEQTEGASSSVASWTAGWVSSISKYVSTSSSAKPETTPAAPPTSSYQPSQRQTQEVKTTIRTTSEERRDNKWDEDQWEDFGNDDTKKGTTHSSSGWDDEMWESFEPTPKKTTPTGRAPPSSSMKLSKNKSLSPPPDTPPGDDFWSRLETSKPSTRGRDKTTPPP